MTTVVRPRRFAVPLLGVAALAACGAWAGPARGDQMTFSNRADFEAAVAAMGGGLFTEDFEAADVAPNGAAVFDDIISATTDNAVFSPGDLLPGFGIDALQGGQEIALGDDGINGASKTVGVAQAVQRLRARFFETGLSGGLFAFGADLYAAAAPGPSVATTQRVDLFANRDDDASLFAGFDVTLAAIDGAFFGVISDEAFLEVRIDGVDNSTIEVVDNLSFAFAQPAPVPEPGSLLLIAAGLAGAGATRRLRRAA